MNTDKTTCSAPRQENSGEPAGTTGMMIRQTHVVNTVVQQTLQCCCHVFSSSRQHSREQKSRPEAGSAELAIDKHKWGQALRRRGCEPGRACTQIGLWSSSLARWRRHHHLCVWPCPHGIGTCRGSGTPRYIVALVALVPAGEPALGSGGSAAGSARPALTEGTGLCPAQHC